MADVEIKKGAIEQILKSQAVKADLLRRAKAIAAAAGPGHEASTWDGTTRARASVRTTTPEAMRMESYHQTLTRSIDAGR